MNTINGIYRTGNCTANLINGDSVVKPNQSIKDPAGKKPLRDYSKLISQDYFREDLLEDYHESDSDETGGALYDSDGKAPFEDGGRPNRKGNDNRDNKIHII